MNDYRIELGIGLQTDDFADIKKKINSLEDNPIKLKIDSSAVTSEINDIKKELNNLGNTKGLKLDTSKLETSLTDVKGDIGEIRNLLSSLGSGTNMKGLVGSIGQISTALEKASGKFDELAADLKTLSSKDFSVNIGIKLGGSNSVSNNAAYGDYVKDEVLPSLKKQEQELTKYIAKHFNTNEISALNKLAGGSLGGFNGIIETLDRLESPLKKGESLKDRMRDFKNFINVITSSANAQGIDLSPVLSQFEKLPNELIESADKIRDGTKQVDDSVDKLKQAFGGGVGAEQLSAELEPIVSDLNQIREAIQNLSKGVSLDGLTASFDRLSSAIENLLANAEKVKGILNSGFDVNAVGGTSASTPSSTSAVKSAQQTGQKIGETVKQSVKQSLTLDDVIDEQVQNLMNQYGIVGKKGSKAFEEIKQAIVEYRAQLALLNSDSTIDDDFIEIFDEEDVADIRQVTSALTSNMKVADQTKEVYEDLVKYIKEINNSGHKVYLPDTIKQEYGDDFSRMRSQLGKAFTTSQSGVDFESWVMELNAQLGNVIDLSHGAEAAFGDLVNKVQMGRDNGYLSGDDLIRSGMLDIDDVEIDIINALGLIEAKEKQLVEVSNQAANAVIQDEERKQQAYRETADAVERVSQIKIGDTKLDTVSLSDDKDDVDEFVAALSRLKNVQKNIDKIEIAKIDTSKTVQELDTLKNQLESLSAEYNETVNELNKYGGLSKSQWQPIQNEIDNTKLKLQQLESQIEGTKSELADKIKLEIDTDIANKINKVHSDFDKLSNKTEELRHGLKTLDDIKIDLDTAKAENDIDALIDAKERYVQALKDINSQLAIAKRAEQDANRAANIEQQKSALEQRARNLSLDMSNWLTDNSAAAKQFGGVIKELQMRLQACDDVEFNNIKGEFQQIQKEAKALGLTTKTVGDRIKQQFAQYSTYLSVAEVFMWAEQGLRDMFEQVKLIDSAMTELKKVTDETDASYNQFLSKAASRSKELGTTIDGLVSSTADFARLGYGFEDAQGLAEVANIYAVVGDEIEGVEGATESLVSTLAAFKDELSGVSDTDFAMDIIDKFNEVSNNFAISSGGIGEAMQRSASSLRAANNTIDESIALITAANTVVQDPTVVGTAFKTISMRIRGAKTELEEAGLETEGMVESTATLRAEIEALTGVDIMKNANEFKSTYQIMDELAAKWQDLTDIQQATVTELIAGKRQGNIVSSLMQNFDTARQALDTSLNSSGSAMREHEKWSQSLEARLNKLKSTWQSLAQSFMDSKFLKGALDAIIGLVDGVNGLINAVGTLPTLLGVFAAFESFKGVGLFQTIENDATLSGKKITNIFAETARQTQKALADISLKADSSFKTSIDADIDALTRLNDALRLGVDVDRDTFDTIFKDASVSARKFAEDGKLATEGIDGFVKAQKEAQVATLAQNKSLGNARAIINEYFAGCKNVEMSQESFANSVGKTNPKLAQQLTATNTAKGAFAKYAASLVGAKVASFALEAATMALNAALTMGISFLVSTGISAIMKWLNADKELAEKVTEVTSKYKEQHEELKRLQGDYDTSNESSMISKYEKLSKGVDGLGRNISLTADEYLEYQNIVNQIADQIPSLVTGYDSQGNAILSCKGNVEELTAAYEKLIHAQNTEILTNAGNIEESFSNVLKKASGEQGWNDGHGFWKGLIKSGTGEENFLTKFFDYELKGDTVKSLEKLLDGSGKYNKDKIFEELKSNEFSESEIRTLLKNADVDIDYSDDAYEVLEKTLETNPAKIKNAVDNYYTQFADVVEEQKTIGQAKLSEAFDVSDDISGVKYDNISEELQQIAHQTVNSLDFDFFSELSQNGQSFGDWVDNMLNQLNALDKSDSAQIEAAFDLQTKFNGGDISYGEYVKGIQNTSSLIDGLDLSDEVKNQIKLTLNTDEVTDNYEALKNRLTEKYELNMETDKAEKRATKFLDGLTASEYQVAIDLIDDPNVNFNDFDSIKELRKYIKEQAALTEALNYTIAMDVETESLSALNTAMAESVTGAGLSSEAIAALKGRYAELESEGYDLSAMFEETANGIHLNRKAVSELEQKLASDKLAETDKQLGVLKNRYDELTTEIDKCRDASDRAALYTEQQSIVDKINDLGTLAAQYEGLTSAYNAWQNAESAGSERDMYESMLEGFENIGDEISRGWMDDGTIEFLKLIRGEKATIVDSNGVAKEINIATASAKELKQVWNDLDDTIKHTSYSVKDFFTVDEDGNSTSQGVYNFLDAIGQLEEEEFGGKDVVKRDKNGRIIEFDFKVAGGEKAVADALGISEELVQIMLRAADDAGFVINLEGAYTQLADLKTEAEAARDTLISLQKNGLAKLKGVDVNFNLDAEGNDLVDEQEKAVKLLDKFKKDGKIDLKMEGAQQALDIAEYLTIKLDDLTEPKIMQIDVSEVDEDLRDPIEKMQEIVKLSKEKNLVSLTGDKKEIKATQKEINKVAKELEELDPEVKAKVGIDEDWDSKTIADKIAKGEVEIPAELELDVQMSDDLKDMRLMMMNQLGLVDDNEVKLKIGFDIDDSVVDGLTDEQKEVVVKYLAEHKEVDDYTPEQKEALVKYIADGGNLDNYTPEEKQSIVKYLADGGNISDYTPEQKQAIVEYLTDSGDPDNWTPEQKEAVAKFKKDSAEVDNYTPEDKKAIAKFIKDSSEPDGYQPPNKTQSVKADLDSSEPDNYQPKDKKFTVKAILQKIGDWTNKLLGGGSTRKVVNGTANVDGTAFVRGTTGRAFKHGDWGTEDSGTALVGELGTETLVRNGRYYTIGNTGAEFIHYEKGDIIFNHKQTEELFRYGKVTSGGGRGKAFANGTAFPYGSSGTGGGIMPEVKSYVVKADNVKVESKKTETKSSSSKSSKSSTSSKSKTSTSSKSSSSSSTKEDFEESFDWIEVKISRLERAIDRLDKKASGTWRSWTSRNSALAKEISKVSEEINLQEKAYDAYIKEANSVGLSSSWKKKVQNGTLDISTVKDEKLAEKIKDYQTWYLIMPTYLVINM